MAHTLPVLIAFGFAVLFTSCDNSEPAKVPLEAGRGLKPRVIDRPAPAPTISDDPVAAWVNDEPIKTGELEAELTRLRSAIRSVPPGRRQQVLQRMIDERLLAQWSEEHPVPGPAVDTEIHRLETEVFGSRDALLRHLEDRGLSLEEYRAELSVELAAAQQLRPSAPPDDEQLADLYRDITNRPPQRTLVRLSSVLIDPEADPKVLDPQLAAVGSEASFKQLPGRQVSLGWVDRSAIGEPLARVVFAVEPPGRSQPVRTPAGTEIYWVHERAEQPTLHFRELEPLLRERAAEMQLSHARTELVRQLRESADIRIASVAREQPKPLKQPTGP